MNQIKKWLEHNAHEEMNDSGLDGLFGVVTQELHKLPIKRTLAVGCGNGTELNYLPGDTVIGLDINPKNQASNVDIGDMHDMAYQDKEFDLVYSRDSFEHAVAPIAALAEMSRVSSKYVCIVLPDEVWTERPEHLIIPTDRQLQSMAEKVGLAQVMRRDYRLIIPIPNTAGYLMIQHFYLFQKI